MHCPQCGKPVLDNQKFCGSCGYNLLDSQASAYTEPTPPPTRVSDAQWNQIPQTQNPSPVNPKMQKPKKKKGKVIIALMLILLILGAGIYGVFKLNLLPGFDAIDRLGSNAPVEVTNVRFALDPADQGTVHTTFSSVPSMTVLADLKNVKDFVEVEIVWLYENTEIITDKLTYQAGDYIEYTIETTDGTLFEIGTYRVVFYMDGVAVANASFEVQ